MTNTYCLYFVDGRSRDNVGRKVYEDTDYDRTKAAVISHIDTELLGDDYRYHFTLTTFAGAQVVNDEFIDMSEALSIQQSIEASYLHDSSMDDEGWTDDNDIYSDDY